MVELILFSLCSPNVCRNGWGASAIDALGTAAIMGMTEVVDEILVCAIYLPWAPTDCSHNPQTHVQNTDFTNAPVSSDNLSVFESTVRIIIPLSERFKVLIAATC